MSERGIPPAGERSPDPSPDMDHIRAALLDDAGCAVAVLDGDRRLVECNPRFEWVLGSGWAGPVVGAALEAICHKSAIAPHARAHGMARANQPTAVDGPLGSMLARSTYRPMSSDPCRVLLVVAPWRPDWKVPPGITLLVADARYADSLASLTPREKEVLEGIGLGLTTAEIAKRLHRSTKTVEGHRVSLGIKLGVNNRVQLARLAIRYGIAPLSSHFLELKPPDRYADAARPEADPPVDPH